MKPMNQHRTASPHCRVWAIAFALLIGLPGGAAADEFRIGGTGAALGTMRLLADKFTAANPDVRVAIMPNLGSNGGIKAVAAGVIGLAVTSRPMNESDRGLGVAETEYARTPFVFAVSTKSSITEITRAELAGIYAGKIVTWADGSPLRIVLRPASDIDTELVRNISPEFRRALAAAEARPGVQFSMTDQDAAKDLEDIRGAIGPTSLALIVSEQAALRALKLDGTEPTPANAASGAYPLVKRLFFVTGQKHSAAVDRFLAFVQSPVGRTILIGNGQWIP